MPSPFPGMDPFLEDSEHWTNVHHRLITEIGDRLSAQLRPRYFVGMEERAYITNNTDPAWKTIIPDTHVVRSRSSSGRLRPGSAARAKTEPVGMLSETDSGGVAVMAEPITIRFPAFEMREQYLEIIDARNRKIVTIIEVLSPTNKVAGSRGRRKYGQKRQRVFRSSAHLVEIDLLRGGRSFFNEETRDGCDYTVHVSRDLDRADDESQLWQIRLEQLLPTIPIPLCEGDADGSLDLSSVWHTIYDKAGFDLVLDYKSDPATPLTPDQAAWMDRLLKSKGLR